MVRSSLVPKRSRIQESGFGARTGARLDELEDALTDMSEYAGQLALQFLSIEDARKYAGPNAEWQQLSTEDAFTTFYIDIKAGSTGKPQEQPDREQWGTLMPLIREVIDRIGAARMQGQEWAAKPWIALLKETFNRLDDHADIEEFLPVVPEQLLNAPPPEPIS